MGGFPRLYAAASLKLRMAGRLAPAFQRFPRLYAAASLKLHGLGSMGHVTRTFSAALCRGLIEAAWRGREVPTGRTVFRGFMPRPH